MDRNERERLEAALNEATVCGLRSPRSGEVRVLLEVSALPETGPIDPDPRQELVFHGVTGLDVVLRRTTIDGDGPAIALADLEEADAFLGSLACGGPMHGWRFIDAPELTSDWPAAPSLSTRLAAAPAPHTFYWFNECARHANGSTDSFCIEGTITFEDLGVLRADGEVQALTDFIDDRVRWWTAFNEGDPRVSVDAQSTAQSPGRVWRDWPGIPVPPAGPQEGAS